MNQCEIDGCEFMQVGRCTFTGRDATWKLTGKKGYCHAFTPTPPIQSVTPSQINDNKQLQGIRNVTRENDVTVENPGKPAMVAGCDGVTLEKEGIGGNNMKTGLKSDQGELFSDEQQANVDAAFL